MFLSKYGVARHIYIPIVKRAVVDFAVGADWTPAAGDVKISKDGGAAANVTNLPTAIAMGNGAIWDFSLTATEMQAAQVVVTVADSATKAVEDQAFIIETHGNASAQFQVDLADSVRAGLTALPNATVSGVGGLLTAPTTANVGLADLSRILGTALTETSGQIAAAFKKFFDKATPTGTINSIPDAVAGASGGLFIAGTNAATTVTTALTTTFTGNLTGSVGSVTGAVGSVTGAVGSVTGNVGGNVTGSVGSVVGAVGSVTGAVGSVTGNVGGNVTGSVGSVAGAVGSVTGNVGGNVVGSVGSVTGLTASNLDATISSRASAASLATAQTSIDDIPTNAELTTALGTADDATLAAIAALSIPTANANADALLDRAAGVETGWTFRQAMRIMLSALAGKASGLATTTAVYRDMADSKDRISATVDADGNRSAVTRDAT